MNVGQIKIVEPDGIIDRGKCSDRKRRVVSSIE